MSEQYYGPTVEEAAEARLVEVAKEIEELLHERTRLKSRVRKYQGSKMLESERVATQAEAFMSNPLGYWGEETDPFRPEIGGEG